MYIARYTNSPEADIKRGWSGFMGVQAPSVRKYVSFYIYDDTPENYDDMTTQEIVEWLAELGTDLRFNDIIQMWCAVHHDGLSCWPLTSQTAEQAALEAKAKDAEGSISWSGFGYTTRGKVTLINKVDGTTDPLYIFECDNVTVEA